MYEQPSSDATPQLDFPTNTSSIPDGGPRRPRFLPLASELQGGQLAPADLETVPTAPLAIAETAPADSSAGLTLKERLHFHVMERGMNAKGPIRYLGGLALDVVSYPFQALGQALKHRAQSTGHKRGYQADVEKIRREVREKYNLDDPSTKE